jgi:hypothetical protein
MTRLSAYQFNVKHVGDLKTKALKTTNLLKISKIPTIA